MDDHGHDDATHDRQEAELRAALRMAEPEVVMAILSVVDPVHLAGPGKPKAPIAALAKAARKERSPEPFLTRAPGHALLNLAAITANGALSAVVEALGEHAEDPSLDQLREGLEAISENCTVGERRLMLALAVAEHFQAALHCTTILGEEPYALDPRLVDEELQRGRRIVAVPATSIGADEDKKAKRRERRLAEAEARRAAAEQKAEAARQRRARQAAARNEPYEEEDAAPSAPRAERPGGVVEHWRSPMLTPAEASRFSPDDPWAGGVVLAFVPFDGRDPAAPTQTGKVRPCVVVAGNASHLLVRGCYSSGGALDRSIEGVPLGGWRQAGLDGPSTVADVKVEVERHGIASPRGWLGIADWNLLW